MPQFPTHLDLKGSFTCEICYNKGETNLYAQFYLPICEECKKAIRNLILKKQITL